MAEKESVICENKIKIEKQEARIAQLEKRVNYLCRLLYGGKAERYINPTPDARQLDLFEGVEFLPGEKEAAQKAEKEIKEEKEARDRRGESTKNKPIRESLPEHLECKIEHVYPRGYNTQEWDLLDEKEPLFTEVLVK